MSYESVQYKFLIMISLFDMALLTVVLIYKYINQRLSQPQTKSPGKINKYFKPFHQQSNQHSYYQNSSKILCYII